VTLITDIVEVIVDKRPHASAAFLFR